MLRREMTGNSRRAESIADQLAAEAECARVALPPGLHHRTLAAVVESARRGPPAVPAAQGRRLRPAWPVAVAALAGLAILAIAAVPRLRPGPAPPPRPEGTARALTIIDPARITAALSRRAGAVESASETRLLAEAGLVAGDLRRIGAHMMANLPVPEVSPGQR